MVPTSLYVPPCVNHFPCVYPRPVVSVLRNRIWQLQKAIMSKIGLSKIVISFSIARSLMLALPLALSLVHSDEASCHVLSCPTKRPTWQGTEGHLAEKQALSSTANEELNFAKSITAQKWILLPLTCEVTALLVNTLIVALREIQRTQPPPDFWPTESGIIIQQIIKTNGNIND